MPLQGTSGAASQDAFGGNGVAVVPQYIEEVFSTWLYTGNSTSQTITNGIDLSTNGGLVWFKNRTAGSTGQMWYDTARGAYNYIQSDSTGAQANGSPDGLSAFTTSGFSLNGASDYWNLSANNYCSWTFRKQPKFFDIVTYTGDGTNNRAIAHSLGSVPGCIIVKSTSGGYPWAVKHRSLSSASQYLVLNTTAAETTTFNPWSTDPTSTNFYVNGSASSLSNGSGATYVAYLFAHNAGGFGLLGTDNVISCGSCVSDGSGYIQPVSLGYEPQWVMLKRTNSAANWVMMDTMRGMANTAAAASPILLANTNAAEAATGVQVNPTATGFEDTLWGGWGASNTYIYIAIRRGPMKVPTSGTSVYNAIARTGTGAATTITGVGFPPDLAIPPVRGGGSKRFYDRLRGALRPVYSDTTDSEATETNSLTGFDAMDGVKFGSGTGNVSSTNYINWYFRRAPSVFDIVCYTGTGSVTAITHNLGVAPQFIITKTRSGAGAWYCGANFTSTDYTGTIRLNSNFDGPAEAYSNTGVFAAAPTSTTFTAGSPYYASGVTYVAYLFATCAGVSKVFSYTGNGSSQTINCGFTAGARFVLIKRTDSTGDWYVWDSARGIVAGNDPRLSLNTTSAEVTTDDSVDTDSTGFIVNQVAATNVNVSSATYIGIAIA